MTPPADHAPIVASAGRRRAFVALSRSTYRALSDGYRPRAEAVWGGDVEVLDRSLPEPRWRPLARLVRDAARFDAVVLDGSIGIRQAYVDLLAAAAIARRRGGPVVVITDCTWKRGTSPPERWLRRAGIRILDRPRVTYCVLTRAEQEVFPKTWGVDRRRVAWTRWPYIVDEEHLATPTSMTGGVFAGGDSLRDYDTVIAAARGLDAPVTIATRRDDVVRRPDLPANVTAGPVSAERYVELMMNAAVVVVPLSETRERSAGQTTYVNALALGKLVVVPDCLGVRDYVEDRVTGLVVPPRDPHALRAALRWALDPANGDEVHAIRTRARAFAEAELTPDGYLLNVLRVAREALERDEGRVFRPGLRP